MAEPKYKKKWVGIKSVHLFSKIVSYNFYRLQALRDIPEHNVKAGDLGGYVHRNVKISHEGSCWVGGNAQVIGKVSIEGNAYIGDEAVVWSDDRKSQITIKDNVKVSGHALIRTVTLVGQKSSETVISENAQIFGFTSVRNARLITGNAKIYDQAKIYYASLITDQTHIFGHANVQDGCQILGFSSISGNASVRGSSVIRDTNLAESAKVDGQSLINGKPSKTAISSSVPEKEIDALEWKSRAESVPPASSKSFDAYNEVMAKISAYETDIVKIIKYPIMTDRTDTLTREMVMAVNNAKRYVDDPSGDDFKDSVLALENAFLSAESNARKIASTVFSEDERKKTERAKDLFRIASNEASTEQEKKVAFKQGFKQLEGILDVPDEAIDTFRIKIGLKELEA
jgi:carbonic anhydrase/acetyltransferase-like protein (isoleucine patch superfamily)